MKMDSLRRFLHSRVMLVYLPSGSENFFVMDEDMFGDRIVAVPPVW